MPNTFSIEALQAKRKAVYEQSLKCEQDILALQAQVTAKSTELSGLNNTVADLDDAIGILQAAAV